MAAILLENRYRVLRELANGRFGKTFLAEDTQMPSGKKCIIKQLKPIENSPQVDRIIREKFQREAATLETLGDINSQIPRLYAYFVEAGEFYLVQEWIQGQTLSDRVQQVGLFSEREVKEILLDILPVLQYIHSQGIIHRDLKPNNIIWRSRDSKPVLIDFGTIKEIMGTTVTASGRATSSIVVGTPGFIPNEQAAGKPLFASDLYALGLTAIYLLTGKMPQELKTNPLTGEIHWRQQTLNVSPKFAAILDKTIQPSARDRYMNAPAMLAALQQLDTHAVSPKVSAPQTPPTATLPNPTPPKVSAPQAPVSATPPNPTPPKVSAPQAPVSATLPNPTPPRVSTPQAPVSATPPNPTPPRASAPQTPPSATPSTPTPPKVSTPQPPAATSSTSATSASQTIIPESSPPPPTAVSTPPNQVERKEIQTGVTSGKANREKAKTSAATNKLVTLAKAALILCGSLVALAVLFVAISYVTRPKTNSSSNDFPTAIAEQNGKPSELNSSSTTNNQPNGVSPQPASTTSNLNEQVKIGRLKTYTYNTNLFSIDVPEDWQRRDRSTTGEAIVSWYDPTNNAAIVVDVFTREAFQQKGQISQERLNRFLARAAQQQYRANPDFQLAATESVSGGWLQVHWTYTVTNLQGKKSKMLGYGYVKQDDDKISYIHFIVPETQYPQLRSQLGKVTSSYSINSAAPLP
ncbi:protein kinase [Chroococcidiopsis sp. FACHB-1243]|uniref:serine/threonine-protein kinase n=1 Tax=Chroococcidiopsis sp. [FACHB-1243] TaxID=2692781 RepID=UPI00178397C9|nr:serine/threonine-protein kinase [Chroococcidiopsis sp. [FACHB-1243]]MBD2309667.1 protein kinase [Chroococcidiopsis sp. [FACHB-1243]]